MKSVKRRSTHLPTSIRQQLERIFSAHHLPSPYILYRTDARYKFLGESPHNLLPSQRRPSARRGWTVFLAFGSRTPSPSGLDRIIAFPDSREHELPLQSVVRLGKDRKPDLKKADLSRIPRQFEFESLEELGNHLARSASA